MRCIFLPVPYYSVMKLFAGVLFVFLLPGFKGKAPVVQAEWKIPQQTFNPFAELGMPKRKDTLTVEEFTITRLVTLGEYRRYLDAVKRDCTEIIYRSQLPDSTMCTPSAYSKYMEPGKYDAYPASGITWISAMNYCRWKAEQDQLPDSMEYRLPFLEDWLSAYRYLRTNNIPNDFSRNYSDWLLNVFDESSYDFYQNQPFSYSYADREGEPAVIRRKAFIGNSFHYQHEYPEKEYAYSFHGYAYIGFRMIKVKKTRVSPKLHRHMKKTKK